VEYKTDWVADLQGIIDIFLKSTSSRNVNEKQCIEALEQTYGYMTFNNTRYGILTNWTRVWCLRRVEEGDRKVMECAGPIELYGSVQSPSILKAFVGIILLAERDWFYASPTPCCPPSERTFWASASALNMQKKAIAVAGYYDVAPIQGTYPCLDLDFRLCDFEFSTIRRSSLGCVVHTNLLQDSLNKGPLPSMCKIVDIDSNPHGRSTLNDEAQAYAALQPLQGKVIPKLYGYYNVWGILHVLALEPVGVAFPNDLVISAKLRKKMKKALHKIHSAGYLHGDIARRNFCQRDNNKVFMVDLERSRRSSSDAEKADEMDLIDSL
jgi:hypothetical protein